MSGRGWAVFAVEQERVLQEEHRLIVPGDEDAA